MHKCEAALPQYMYIHSYNIHIATYPLINTAIPILTSSIHVTISGSQELLVVTKQKYIIQFTTHCV